MSLNKPEEVAVVTTSDVVGEKISETYGYVCSTYLSYFFINKSSTVDKSLDIAFQKIQYEAFKNGADAVVSVATKIELQSQYLLYTRVSVFMEGTMVVFESND